MSEVDVLKERVKFLEQQMRDLRSAVNGSSAVPAWKRKIGLFADDEAFASTGPAGLPPRLSQCANHQVIAGH